MATWVVPGEDIKLLQPDGNYHAMAFGYQHLETSLDECTRGETIPTLQFATSISDQNKPEAHNKVLSFFIP